MTCASAVKTSSNAASEKNILFMYRAFILIQVSISYLADTLKLQRAMHAKGLIVILIAALFIAASHPSSPRAAAKSKPIITGADQTAQYLPLLKGKRVGIL